MLYIRALFLFPLMASNATMPSALSPCIERVRNAPRSSQPFRLRWIRMYLKDIEVPYENV